MKLLNQNKIVFVFFFFTVAINKKNVIGAYENDQIHSIANNTKINKEYQEAKKIIMENYDIKRLMKMAKTKNQEIRNLIQKKLDELIDQRVHLYLHNRTEYMSEKANRFQWNKKFSTALRTWYSTVAKYYPEQLGVVTLYILDPKANNNEKIKNFYTEQQKK